MRITYDKQADAMSIRFNKRRSVGAQPINDFVNLGLAEDGTIVGIELLALSMFADDIEAIAEQYDIQKVLDSEQAERRAE